MSKFKPRVVDAARVAKAEALAEGVPDSSDEAVRAGVSPHAPAVFAARQRGGGEYEIGQVYEVPLRRIRENPFNARAFYPKSAIDEMAISLQERGQLVAALGFVDEDGDITLLEGHTRLKGTQKIGKPTLRVEVQPRPNSDQAFYEISRATNVERKAQSVLDDAVRWKELLARKTYLSQVALAKSLGFKDSTQVSRTVPLADLPARMLDTVADFPDLLTLKMLNALREFYEARGEDETLALVLEAGTQGLGYREVEARRKAAVKGPVKRPRSEKHAVTFKGARGELRVFEAEGRIELSLKGLTDDAAAELRKRLEQVLAH